MKHLAHLEVIRMKRFLLVLVGIALAAPPAAGAKTIVIKSNWHESFQFTSLARKCELKLHVTRLEVSGQTWTAKVGVTNRSPVGISLQSTRQKPFFTKPFVYWAAPGLWWSTLERNGSWYPGGGTVLTHSARAGSVTPALPKTIAKGKSWFGTFSGSLATVPKDRLLRIGFGTLVLPPENTPGWPAAAPKELPVSTTHQFKLPRV